MSDNPTKDLLDLVMHPVRMRIVMLLAGSAGMTPQQITERVRDVPLATLYRHINRLVKGRLLVVVEERPVRGTLEKVYALDTASGPQIASEQEALDAFNRLDKQDHLRYFTSFLLSLLDDYSYYLSRRERGPLDAVADGVGYHKLPLFLSDEEFSTFGAALNQAIAPFLGLPDAPGRRKRLFTTVMMPSDAPDGESGPETL